MAKFRETNLQLHLQSENINFNCQQRIQLKAEILKSKGLDAYIDSCFHDLGGLLELPPITSVPLDFVNEDLIIELDEEQHFNRYRAITLRNEFYSSFSFPWRNRYMNYCHQYENKCKLKAGRGGYWANNSTEKQFGKSSIPGDLNGSGSSRWKQRAYYDFLKDVFSIVSGRSMIRISIYDNVETSAGEMLFGELLSLSSEGMH
jgi:hypothetical protein